MARQHPLSGGRDVVIGRSSVARMLRRETQHLDAAFDDRRALDTSLEHPADDGADLVVPPMHHDATGHGIGGDGG